MEFRSTNTNTTKGEQMTAFERFWSAWPRNGGRYSRKGGKAACLAVWTKRYHFTQADQIIKHVEWLKTTADWLKDGGAYIPAPIVYLNQQRWDGAEIPEYEAPSLNREVDATARYIQERASRVPEPPSETNRAKLDAVRNSLRRGNQSYGE